MNILWDGPVSFATPIAVLVPFLLLILQLFRKKKERALLFSSTMLLEGVPSSLRQKLRGPILSILLSLFLFFLTVALLRPQRITILPETREARSLVLALDISRSMRANDFRVGLRTITRLDGVKNVVTSFLRDRSEDRIGLVVFGSSAFLQSPLTFDHELLSQIMSQLQVGLAGDGTAIGDGLGISLKRLEAVDSKRKSVVLMTDGVSNAGRVKPLQAARVAKELGVVVHTIGIGPDQSVLSQGLGFLNRERHFDEETLREIARITGGVYFYAGDIEKLQRVYQEIDRIEKTTEEEPAKIQVEELFIRPLTVSLLAYVLYCLLGLTVFRRVP